MRVLTRPNVGGPTLQAIALWHAHKRLGVRTLLAVGRCAPNEPSLDLAAHGIPAVSPDRVTRDSEGFLEVEGLGNGFAPIRLVVARRALRRAIRAFAPDVVHTHTSAAGFCGRTAAFAERVPRVVHTFHGIVLRDYFGSLVSWALLRLEARLARSTHALLAVSPSCRDELVELGVAARERFFVVRPAVPLPTFVDRREARAQLGLGDDTFAIATYGRLVPVKRVDHFVAAVDGVQGSVGHVHGGGPLASLLRRLASPRVTFFGSSERARTQLKAYDALVLSSRREGCPLVAVEAFAAGVPVVGYDVPGVRDVLSAWGSGLLVPEREGPQGLCRALVRVRDDRALVAGIVQAAQAKLRAFAPDAVAAELLAIYRARP
ncbi:MAG: glycosyltransferase family 4 protein [Planctomycetota bacterium]